MSVTKDLTAASATPLVLSILQRKESYGYAIIQDVKASSGGALEWSEGMLYPVLHRLEKAGLVRASWSTADTGRRRRYYAITSRGRKELQKQRADWKAVNTCLESLWGGMQHV